jgi:16S rRNA (guanine527-N7)-methyltransferase
VTTDAEIVRALAPAANVLGRPLTDAQLRQVISYLALIVAWSKRARLTAITRPLDAVRLHVLDSLLCLRADLPHGASLIDVGSGAGLPGIPLKIARPDLQVTLLEAAARKAAFLDLAAAELRLDVAVIGARAEEAVHDPRLREQFDAVVARAVAPLAALCELTLPFARVGGKAVLLKGPAVDKELALGGRAASWVGGGEVGVITEELPGGVRRAVVIIGKIGPTPPGFPRRPGAPVKRPLGA